MTDPPQRESTGPRAGRWLRLGLVVMLACAGVAAWSLDLDLRPTALRDWLRDSGVWGPLLFVVAFMAGELVAIPSFLFVIAAGLTWPVEVALAVAWIGCVLAATGVFLVARYAARGFVQGRLPKRLRDLDQRVARGGLWAVAAVRLATYLHPAVHSALGVSSVRARDYVLGTAIGVAPLTALLVIFGDRVLEAFSSIPSWVWVLAGVGGVVWLYRAATARRRAVSSDPEES